MENYTFDLQRIFLGDLPFLFWAEILLRTTVLYLYSLLFLRLMGKRSTSQLTPVDVILIVALGSAVGDPMYYPDVPVVHGMVVISLIIFFQRLLMRASKEHERFEKMLKGEPTRLVVDGMFDYQEKEGSVFSRSEIMARLREAGYRQLGEVDRMYVETDGNLSHYQIAQDKVQPGLPLTPPWKLERPEIIEELTPDDFQKRLACTHCGNTLMPGEGPLPPCPRCHKKVWVKAAKP
jgi:uncharacterized membrane protein YcaP (DUF421 family)